MIFFHKRELGIVPLNNNKIIRLIHIINIFVNYNSILYFNKNINTMKMKNT